MHVAVPISRCVFASLLTLLIIGGTDPVRAAAPPSVVGIGHEAFESAVRQAVASPDVLSDLSSLKVLHLSGDVGPWLDTGLVLAKDQPVTLLMTGKLWWSRAAKLSLSPAIAVWAQVGSDGSIFNGTRDTHTFTASVAGPLRLKLFPGVGWTSPQGDYVGDPTPVNPDAGGGVSVAVLAWKPGVDVAAQMRVLARQGTLSPWAEGERNRLEKGVVLPPVGWRYFWPLGPSEIFSSAPTGSDPSAPVGPLITARTHDDVGILQKDAPFELGPGTLLRWQWRVDALPSASAENTIPTHDYLSVAVEFDNGRDLSFIWSHSLPVGHAFDCPLPAWKGKETHIVTRSGADELGRWHSESLDLHAAYQRAVGGAMPARVTRVWLIANSVFQKREGRGQFAGIELVNGERRLRVE